MLVASLVVAAVVGEAENVPVAPAVADGGQPGTQPPVLRFIHFTEFPPGLVEDKHAAALVGPISHGQSDEENNKEVTAKKASMIKLKSDARSFVNAQINVWMLETAMTEGITVADVNVGNILEIKKWWKLGGDGKGGNPTKKMQDIMYKITYKRFQHGSPDRANLVAVAQMGTNGAILGVRGRRANVSVPNGNATNRTTINNSSNGCKPHGDDFLGECGEKDKYQNGYK